MSLNLILDKSSFPQLNRDEHAECSRHFIDNVTPVLLREILGDLSKEAKPGTSSADVVASLARKFLGSGGPINHHYSVMCVGELNGNKVPIGHGAKGSLLTALWLKRWGPWYRGRGNRAIKQNEAEQEQALTEAEELVRASQA